MATQIEALNLKGNLKANKSLEDALNDNKKMRNKKNRGDKTRDKEDEAWKEIPPKDGDKKKRRWASTRSTGVNITWSGACITPPIATWAISARRSSRQPLEATPPPMPLLPPFSPTLNSKPSLPACKGGSMRTDGAHQHAYGFC